MKKIIFLCISTAIAIFTVIVLNLVPIINNIEKEWYDNACKYYTDKYKYDKDKTYASQEIKDKYLDYLKEGKKVCENKKAMEGLEYAAFNADVIFGCICSLLGLLHFLDSGKNIGKIAGLAGICCGIIGFILTFAYIIESGIIFTQYVVDKVYNDFNNQYQNSRLKIDSDGGYLKWDDSKKSYVCIFYKKDKEDSLYIKFSDYGNKYLNYNKDIEFAEEEKNFKFKSGCNILANPHKFYENTNYYFSERVSTIYEACKLLDEGKAYFALNSNKEKIFYIDENGNKAGDCDKMTSIRGESNYSKKNEYNCWITSIVLGCFIFVLDIGLAIFGFLLFKDSNGSSGEVSIK